MEIHCTWVWKIYPSLEVILMQKKIILFDKQNCSPRFSFSIHRFENKMIAENSLFIETNQSPKLSRKCIETKSDNICILTTSCRTSSGTFLWWLHILYAELWLNITGASVTFRAAIMVALATWDKSTSIPNRFISLITTWSRKIREDPHNNQSSS